MYVDGAETPAEEARGLRRLAAADPDAVRVSSVLALLDRAERDRTRGRNALEALRRVAAARPDDCRPAIPILRSLLDEECAPEGSALAVLRKLAENDAGDVAPFVDELVPYVDAEGQSSRVGAVGALAAVADEYTGDVVPAVPKLASLIEDEREGADDAMLALSRIAEEHPDAVKPVADTLGVAATDPSRSDAVRLCATAALGNVVTEYPGLAADIVDDLAALLDVEDYRLRNNAMALLCDVATVHNDLVEPFADEIRALLTVEDTFTRINASATLARIAKDFPDSVEGISTAFIELLSDDDERVRENACWGLGYLRAKEARDALERCASDDEDDDVRHRAVWALAEIGDTEPEGGT